ncbi:MAG TPA: TolC family protein [Hanamia sp.]
MKHFYKSFILIFSFLFSVTSFLQAQDTLITVQDTLLTAQEAIKNAIEHNYGIIISRNETEIGTINNSWANAGAVPIVTADATYNLGLNTLHQKLNNGTFTEKNGNHTQNLAAGLAVNWTLFDGFKMFATKKKLEELERNGEYAFKKQLNEIIYNVINSYYQIVTLKEQRNATLEQMRLYNVRYTLAQRRFEIGAGAKYEVLEAQVDLNAQRSSLISLENSISVEKSTLSNLMGKASDTSFRVADTILVNPLPAFEELQNKINLQNPDILLANSQLVILTQTKKETNAARLPSVVFQGFYNFNKNSNSAGFTLYNQTYGPSGAVGISIPIFNGNLVKRQLNINDIQIKNQTFAVAQTKDDVQTDLTNAYISYNNALKAIELEQNNFVLQMEDINIAIERYKKLAITSVELRQIQTSYNDAVNRLYNALLQGKLAETTIALLTGEISQL